jgi:predicted ester cyclase
MTEVDPVTIGGRVIEEGWNQGRLEVIDELVDPRYVRHTFFGDMHGPEAFKERISMMRSAVSGFHTEIHEIVVHGSSGFCHYTVTGQHTGELLGNPPTGNDIEFGGAVLVHYAGGKLIEEWEYVDTARVLAQFSQPQRQGGQR